MNILAVDTSGNVCSVAVLIKDKVIAEIYVDNKKNHSISLGSMIEDCLKKAELDINEIDLFGCATGPGSFTGLRIGVGMIKSFCHAMRKKCVSVNTLDALAHNLVGDKRILCSVIDARRSQVYTASYKDGKRITEYRAMKIDLLLEELKNKEIVFVGDGAINFKEEIENGGFSIAQSGIVLQHASSVGILTYQNRQNAISAYDLEPIYLRQTQAERVYAQAHKEE